jgi:hypothetical protein
VIDCDKALVNAVSMKAVAEEGRVSETRTGRLRGLVQVVGFIYWLIFGDFGKNLFILIRI